MSEVTVYDKSFKVESIMERVSWAKTGMTLSGNNDGASGEEQAAHGVIHALGFKGGLWPGGQDALRGEQACAHCYSNGATGHAAF